MDRVPRWISLVMAMDRVVDAAARLEAALRDELMIGLVPPTLRGAVTAWIYGRQDTYRAGGGRYGEGLFDWECRRIARPPFPRTGRVLVGGAGGGREVVALVALGFEVVAFEPSESLARAAQQTPAIREAGTQVLVGDYADLVRAVERSDARDPSGGPLAAIARMRFDAVLLGWGSLSHVLDEGERRALLRALARLAPAGPVLASYLARPDATVAEGRLVGRTRAALRWTLARAGAHASVERDPGLRFLPWAGYIHEFAPGEIQSLAASAGYRVAMEELLPYPHAVLVPGEG